ncbi:MAG: hypothetical protein GW898_09110 [Thiomicrospira sp.]|nr:hypothetical protein [Thiomicrospira sp.]NCN67716.1 hypothetical protein [Thiomicrospira sp.]NCO14515.1 hypothetical protein [Thiomicrospira sp.]NCO81007.1 hypothetical protein [Thiomicrospira sp.]OIP95576.1 MAG: hypothetical protein AUK56_04840 [Thiomicrospira sp. CG2_30_44_34]
MQLRIDIHGDYEVLIDSLQAQLQISGKTKSEKNKMLIELALDALEQKVEDTRVKTGKKFPSYTEVKNGLKKGQFVLGH